MKKIIRDRRSGKSTELIKLCAEQGGYIVCRNQRAVEFIAKLAENMKLNIPFPLTYSEASAHRYYAPGVKKIYVDDVDAFLQFLFSDVEVAGISMAVEKEG